MVVALVTVLVVVVVVVLVTAAPSMTFIRHGLTRQNAVGSRANRADVTTGAGRRPGGGQRGVVGSPFEHGGDPAP